MYVCECGHSVEIRNKESFKVCSWCGRKVTRDNQSIEEKQIISYLKKLKRKERKIINGKNIIRPKTNRNI